MDEQTTTDAPVQEQAPETAQPEEQHAEAVTTDNSESTTTTDEERAEATQEPEQSDNSSGDDLSDWATKKGIDLSTPEGQAKALKSWREAEKAMHQSTQRSSELEKQLNAAGFDQYSDDPTAQGAYELAKATQLELQVERWKQSQGITPEQDVAIGNYLQENPNHAYMLKNGYLTLDNIAAMSGALKQDSAAIKQQGSRETLEKLATKQQASSIPSSASTGAAPSALTKDNVEAWWDGLGPAGRADPENRAKLDSVLG